MSLCLPNNRDLDTWFDSVYALPIAWPDITDIGADYRKQVVAVDFRDLRNQLGVAYMWGGLTPQ